MNNDAVSPSLGILRLASEDVLAVFQLELLLSRVLCWEAKIIMVVILL